MDPIDKRELKQALIGAVVLFLFILGMLWWVYV